MLAFKIPIYSWCRMLQLKLLQCYLWLFINLTCINHLLQLQPAAQLYCQKFPLCCNSKVLFMSVYLRHTEPDSVALSPFQSSKLTKYNWTLLIHRTAWLQCYNAVGRAAGRASGLQKTEWWSAGMVMCLERGADLHMAQLTPLPLTVSCSSKIQIGLAFLVPAHPGSPGKMAVKWVCVCDTQNNRNSNN